MHGARRFGIFLLTLLAALVLQMVAVPAFLAPVRPLWVLLLLVAWTLNDPAMPTLSLALVLGLLLDVQLDCPLGQHALGLVLAVWVVARGRTAMTLYPRWQTTLVLAPLWAFYLLLMSVVDRLAHHPADPALRWWPLLPTFVLWPLIDGLVASLHRRGAGMVE